MSSGQARVPSKALLRRPGGFEGCIGIEVGPNPDGLAAAIGDRGVMSGAPAAAEQAQNN